MRPFFFFFFFWRASLFLKDHCPLKEKNCNQNVNHNFASNIFWHEEWNICMEIYIKIKALSFPDNSHRQRDVKVCGEDYLAAIINSQNVYGIYIYVYMVKEMLKCHFIVMFRMRSPKVIGCLFFKFTWKRDTWTYKISQSFINNSLPYIYI